MNKDIRAYNKARATGERAICDQLAKLIDTNLKKTESKVWHAHPVWFLDGNPIVGYSKLKAGIRLMFWSGVSFDERGLEAGTGRFKDASVTYRSPDEINAKAIKRWLKKAKTIQWDYKNIVKRRGKLVRIK